MCGRCCVLSNIHIHMLSWTMCGRFFCVLSKKHIFYLEQCACSRCCIHMFHLEYYLTKHVCHVVYESYHQCFVLWYTVFCIAIDKYSALYCDTCCFVLRCTMFCIVIHYLFLSWTESFPPDPLLPCRTKRKNCKTETHCTRTEVSEQTWQNASRTKSKQESIQHEITMATLRTV